MTTNRMWRILLSFSLCIAISIAILAFLAYNWALRTTLDARKAKVDPNAVSVLELRSINLFYEKKQENFNELLHHKPDVPGVKRGKGVSMSGQNIVLPTALEGAETGGGSNVQGKGGILP